MKYRIAPIVSVIVLTSMATIAQASSPNFGDHWYDGKAELDGYSLTVSRYGQERSGSCVMIYVTEPFSESQRVKVDDASRNPDDTFNVLKLNLVRDFQTGIYDYNTMVSLFVTTSDFAPKKVSFSSAEWCGQVYEELLFYPDKIKGVYHSYFEGESGPREIENMTNGIIEDNLFVLLRGLREPYLEPGEQRTVNMLTSSFYTRLSHRSHAWVKTQIERAAELASVSVPAGTFDTIVYTVSTPERRGTFYIDADYPHRIVRWEMPPDVKGELRGSERLEYWRLNKNGGESYLEKLGL